MLLALASPEVELLAITTVAGNQTLRQDHGQRPARARVRRPRRHRGRRRRRPPARARAGRRRRRPRRDGPRRARPAAGPGQRRSARTRSTSWPSASTPAERPVTLVPTGPLTNVALLLARHPDVAEPRADRADGRRDRRGQRHAGRRVQHLGRPRGGGARVRLRPATSRWSGSTSPTARCSPTRTPQRLRAVRAHRRRSSPTCTRSTRACTARATAGTARPSTTRWRSPTWWRRAS